MTQALRRMAGALSVRGQQLHLLGAGGTHDLKLDLDLFEIGRRIVDVVLLGVAERPADVGAGVIDLDFVEWREPRQLREQSKGGAHHQELQRRRALFGAATSERLVRLDDELAHATLEVDILDDPRHRARRDVSLLGRLGAHLGAQPLDLPHLLLEVDPAARRFHLRYTVGRISGRAAPTWARSSSSDPNVACSRCTHGTDTSSRSPANG